MTMHPGYSSWKEFILHLEGQASEEDDAEARHAVHIRVADLWERKYLQKAKAIVHYQQAFKALPSSLEALALARRVYWELGRIATIERLVGLALELEGGRPAQAALYRELAEAKLLEGDAEAAVAAFAEAIERDADDRRSRAIYEDLTVGDGFADRAAALEEQAEQGSTGADLLCRAALLHRGGGADFEGYEPLLRRAATLDPRHTGVALLLEIGLREAGREEDIALFHGELLGLSAERVALLDDFGRRWLLWHGNPTRAVPFLDQAFREDPALSGLLGFLYESYLEAGDTKAAADLVEAGLERATGGEIRADLLEVAGDLWWRVIGDASLAAHYYAELRRIDPENTPAGNFFEENAMTNDSGSDSTREGVDDIGDESVADAAEEEAVPETAPTEAEPVESVGEPPAREQTPEFTIDRAVPSVLAAAIEVAEQAEAEGVEEGIKAWHEAWKSAPGHPVVIDALERLHGAAGKWPQFADLIKRQGRTIENEGHQIHAQMILARVYDEQLKQDVMVVNTYQAVLKIKPDYLPAIDAAIEKYERMERWPDLVKMLKAKGEAMPDGPDKVEVWLQVAQLFLQRFSNQAEAIKAFEQVLEADPTNGQAIDFLKDMYEKRRDWEKLIGVLQREAEELSSGAERAAKLIDIAKLATERLKRPAVCIELWEKVLAEDPENVEAFSDLAGLYERAKEWEKLAAVLSRQVEGVVDAAERGALLQKLGVVYGDKLEDDARAVGAWKALLEINPEDRRAQEQLKKRYLALRAWNDLEVFYAQSDKWDEFIRILEREAEKPGAEVADRISLQFKIAELWREKKDRIDRAAKCFETVLEIDKDNLRAAEELVPIYEESGKEPAKLADVLEVRLRHVDDTGERLAMRQRIARIAEEEIGDAERAFGGFLEAFGMAPGDQLVWDDLERSAGKAGRWEAVVDAYRGTLENLAGDDRLDVVIRLARVLYEELGRPEDALEHYDAILAKEPKNPRAVAALEKIYAQMGRFEELLDIYARRIEMAEDDEERKEILYNQALLWEEEIGDRGKAIDVYLKIIEMAGDEARSLSALARLHTAEERWPALVDVLQRQLDQGVLEQATELELKHRLGQVLEHHLGDKSRALECYREVLAVEPENEPATSALEGLLAEKEQQGEAARILAPLYEEREAWEKLVGVCEILFQHSDDEFEKLEYLMKQGEIFSRRLGSPERAFVVYSRAFKLNPTASSALEHLEEITAILDSWKELVTLLEEGGRGAEDAEVGKELWLRAARILDTQLDDIDRAVAAYNATLAVDNHNAEAIAALEQIFSRLERWAELIGVFRTKVEITVDASDKEQIYRQMAMIHEEMLEQPEAAVGCLKEILGLDPANLTALAEVDKLYVQLENWTDLADNLQQQLAVEGDPDRITEIKLRLGGLRETRLDEVGAAIEIYREVIESDPENAPALEALERIIGKESFRREVAVILEPVYRTLGSWQKLIEVFEIMIAQEETTARRIDLLHEIAQLYETAGDDPERAFKTYGRALAEDPAEERTQEELERLARVLVLYDDLVKLYAGRVESIEQADLCAAYHLKIARLCEEQLQDAARAIEHYRKVLDIDPMHIEAATALEGAYQITENYQELAGIYLRKVEMVSDLQDQKQLLFKTSQIYEELLELPEKAIEVYLRIIDIDEDDLVAIDQLEGLYLRLERWDDLQGIYNR
ncbi:MAG TPA: tetratricopeptide repeat protein, partial [Polyangia bacterium]|nr:tetratricopeptide repeat protein [Polyangia bacterium]